MDPKLKARILELVAQELDNQSELSTQVLFDIELDASDWTPEYAVSRLFKYATWGGWGQQDGEFEDLIDEDIARVEELSQSARH